MFTPPGCADGRAAAPSQKSTAVAPPPTECPSDWRRNRTISTSAILDKELSEGAEARTLRRRLGGSEARGLSHAIEQGRVAAVMALKELLAQQPKRTLLHALIPDEGGNQRGNQRCNQAI